MITAHIADYREWYMIGLKYDESTMGYKWADGTTISDWNFSNWGPGDPGKSETDYATSNMLQKVA